MSQEIRKEDLELALNQKDPQVLELAKQQIDRIIKDNKLPWKREDCRIIDFSNTTEAWLSRFITVNESMIKEKQNVAKLAPLNEPVLISGPTGTGKEILARAFHGNREGRFVAQNCAGLPEALVESILFGSTKGSFTGAERDRDGLMKAAKGGTFFLDEVGELPMHSQGKFLRALQEKKIMKVGSLSEEEIDCRFVCATNKDLEALCDKNLFRLDLYARISTFEIYTTPLDERPEDIEPIILSMNGGKEFLEVLKNNVTYNLRDKGLDTKLNVRSLEQHVKRHKILGVLPI